jgi:hypothetical protein
VDLHTNGEFRPMSLIVWGHVGMWTGLLCYALGPENEDDNTWRAIGGALRLGVLGCVALVGFAVVKWAWMVVFD